MKKFIQSAVFILALGLVGPAFAVDAAQKATVGEPAPDFTLTAADGETHSLSDFEGQTVVLEWTNHQCPYVEKHYDSGNMQGLQASAKADGVVWLTIVSSAPGKQGHTTGEEALSLMEKQGSDETARLLDESGEVGKLYGAKTTPHMYVVDSEGTLVYAGAIDSNSSANPATIEGATNYVEAALSSLKNGEEIEVASTQPYGCSVKY